MSKAARVIKNTGYLYLKMGITMFTSLFTTRIVLHSLGASDFGIFNIIGGAIAMLGFLNSTLAYATQRFMTYAEGEGQLEKQSQIFNVSLVLHICIATITAVFQLALMYPLFNGILNIEIHRVFAAKIVYLSLLFSTVVVIVNATYDAVLNAHENMRFYSIIGVVDSLLRLLVAVICVYISMDKLIFYGVLMSIIPLISFILTRLYCHKSYPECVFLPRKYWNVSIVKEIASFSGWNFFTAISSLFSVQGVGLILNHFYGSALNAAQGIAVQLNGYLSAFSSNLMKAVNPIIVKNAGARDIASMNLITILSSKYSTYLIMLFAVPCIIEINYLLNLWLGEIPRWTQLFCILQILQAIILQLSAPVATAVYAQGDIKYYSIFKSILNLLPLLLTYIAFRLGAEPFWMYILMMVFYAVGGNVIILLYAYKKCNLTFGCYIKDVICPVSIILFIMFILGFLPSIFINESFIRLCLSTVSSLIGFLIGFLCFGLLPIEKDSLKLLLKNLKTRLLNKKSL